MCYKVRGFFDHIMAYKLKALKNDLKIWNKDVFANVFVRKARALEQIGLGSAKERKGVHMTKIKVNDVWLIKELDNN